MGKFENLAFTLLRLKQALVALVVGFAVFWLVIPPEIFEGFIDLERFAHERDTVLPLGLRALVALVLVLIALRWLWRSESRRLLDLGFRTFPSVFGFFDRRTSGQPGRTTWATLYELLVYRRWKPRRILLGRLAMEQRPFGFLKGVWLGSEFETHILTVAPPGTGKGRAGLIPNLLTYPGSALVVDPKGELARITAGRRGHGPSTLAGSRVTRWMGQDVHIIDPGNQSVFRGEDGDLRGTTARFNPLAELTLADEGFMQNGVDSIVEILLPNNPHSQDPFWDNAARAWIRAVTLHVLTYEPPERHNLPYVRHLVKAGDLEAYQLGVAQAASDGGTAPCAGPVEALLEVMKHNTAFQGEVAVAAQRMEHDLGSSVGRNVMQIATTALEWIGNADMAHILSGSDFSLVDLKKKPTTIYIAMPAYQLRQNNRFLITMILQLANMVMERERRIVPKDRVVFFIDEFTNIGYMKAIEDAFPLMRGLGLSIWAVVQDIDQIQRDYKGAFDVICSSCEIIQIMGTGNKNTARWAADLFGDLLLADDILRLPPEEGKQLVFFRRGRVHRALLELTPYDQVFPRAMYDRDVTNPKSH